MRELISMKEKKWGYLMFLFLLKITRRCLEKQTLLLILMVLVSLIINKYLKEKSMENTYKNIEIKKDAWRSKVYHNLYVNMAVSQFNIAHDAYVKLIKQKDKEANEKIYNLADLVKKNTIATICFSAMALESYVNTIASVYISKSFAEMIDHLEVISKLSLAARVGTGIELKKGEAPLQRIAESVKLRNQLVHSKSKSINFLENGQAAFPRINLKTDFVKPAYESLMAIRDVQKWISSNWPQCVLTICENDFESKIKDSFKNTEDEWYFSDSIAIC